MVRTSGERSTTARPSTIAGGFVLVPIGSLMATWRACRVRPLGIGDFRAWLACHEMKARRGLAIEGRVADYSVNELAKLTGLSTKRTRASVRRLVEARLLDWEGSAIGFPQPPAIDPGPVDTIGRGQGNLAIPRRVLRFLADGARPAIIGVMLALLLRCLSRRKAGFDGRGRVKASWIARTFGISLRQAKAARVELVGLGWIEPEASELWAERRWGRAFRIDLGWSPKAGASSSPIPLDPGSSLSPPDLQTGNPSGREKDQEPARRGGPDGGTGVEIQEAEESREPESDRSESVPGPLPAPTLDDVRIEDLKETARLLELHGQAIGREIIGPSEADRLRFVAAAEHAMAIGKGNPPGLFAYLVRGACWRYSTGADEDRANARIKAHLRGPEPIAIQPIPFGSIRPGSPPGLSEDARIVKAIREASIRAGIFRDPFPSVQGRDPSWTRERWDAALAELGLSRA
jgi:hypothetical protein